MRQLIGDFLCAFGRHRWVLVRAGRTIHKYECSRDGCNAECWEVEPL